MHKMYIQVCISTHYQMMCIQSCVYAALFKFLCVSVYPQIFLPEYLFRTRVMIMSWYACIGCHFTLHCGVPTLPPFTYFNSRDTLCAVLLLYCPFFISANFSIAYQFVVSLYWSTATTTTVGYGDIRAHTDLEVC